MMILNTEFLEELASEQPTPGGGAAAAYAGALASALASMVGNLTVGKKSYADVEEEVKASLEHLAYLRERLVRLVDEDELAFTPLAAAYRMPKNTPEEIQAKDSALQEALVGACDVPLEVMRTCSAVVSECDFLAHKGSKFVISDVGVAAAFARAAIYGASLNVYINIRSMTDEDRALAYRNEADRLIEEGCTLAEDVYTYVAEQIDALY